MKKHTYFNILVLLLLLTGSVQSQTVNTGELYVVSDTRFSTVAAFNNTPTGTFNNDGEVFVYSHFNNDGSVDFTSGQEGYTRFQGIEVQEITGGNISYFYDVLFNNNASPTASFELSGDISISGNANFNEGIVKNDDFGGLVVFEDAATYTGVYDGSHVDGQVQKNGDNSFSYPIGDGSYYRFAEISAPDTASDVFTAKYYLEDTNTNYPVANLDPGLILIDGREHWTIERTLGESDVLVTLSWREETTPEEILVEPLEEIHIARWDEEQQLWVDQGGVVDQDNQTVTTAVDAYGVFTLARVKTKEVPPCVFTVYNLITPNGDNINDLFEIKAVNDNNTCAQNMNVKIFNRWGIKVFEADNYNQSNNKFTGRSDGRKTISREKGLPTGTYFYVLTYDYEADNAVHKFKKTGYLYINDQ